MDPVRERVYVIPLFDTVISMTRPCQRVGTHNSFSKNKTENEFCVQDTRKRHKFTSNLASISPGLEFFMRDRIEIDVN